MAQRIEPGARERRTTSSSGNLEAERTRPIEEAQRGAETTARVIARALDSTIDAPPREMTTQPTSSERLSKLAARLPSVARDAYVVGNQVAKGGIGRVLRARDERLDRPVAIKELLVWNEAQEKRFVREALLTARLQHPAIVPVYEAGRWPDGEPFYAMKLVSGRSLAELFEERATLAERLSLLPHVITAAQAVAYAHSQRILHRDLKPANVLVGEFGETVVIDWGLAKGLHEEDEAVEPSNAPAPGRGLTMEGAVMGTPAYMPPEQARGVPVDERADIYAIGAMLYHLIAAAPPYHDVPWEKLLQTIASEPPRAVEDHTPAISDELSAIVHKAMARDPADRYATAKELADDLHRFQTGQIVAAHTYSSAQLLRRFWRRNRAALSVAGGALGLVTLVVIGAFVKTDAERRFALLQQKEAQAASVTAEQERRTAEIAGRQATERADEMTLLQAQGALAHDPNEALAWLKTLSPSFTDAAEMRRIAGDARARGISRAFRGHTAHINVLTMLPGGKRFLTASDDKSARLWDLDTAESREFLGHTDEVWGVRAFPDGKRFVSGSKDGTVRIWDIETGATLRSVRVPSPSAFLVARADGSVLGATFEPGPSWIWPEGASEVRVLGGPPESIASSAMSEDGRRVVYQRKDGSAFLLEVDTGKERALGARHERGGWSVSSNGRRANFRENKPEATNASYELWDLDEVKSRVITLPERRSGIVFSKSGDLIAIILPESIEVRSAKTDAVVRRFSRAPTPIGHVGFSDDERAVAIGGDDRIVRVWDLTTGESRAHAGFRGKVTWFTFIRGQRSLVATSTLGDVRLVEPPRDGVIVTNHHAKAWGLAVSPDGRIASVDDDGALRITDARGVAIAEHKVEATLYMALSASPDGRRFVGASIPWKGNKEYLSLKKGAQGRALVFGTFDAGKPVVHMLSARIRALTWHPSEEAVLVGLSDGAVQKVLLDGTITEVARLPVGASQLAFSSGGAQLAVGDENGLVRVIDVKTGAARDLGRQTGRIDALAFSKTGAWLASGSRDHTARLWKLADGSFRSFDASGSGVIDLGFTADERELFTLSGGEAHLRRWAVVDGEALAPFVGHQGLILRFVFSADGRHILTSSIDGSARLFDVATGKSRALVDPLSPLSGAEFTLGGAMVVTLNQEGVVRAFPDDLPESMLEMRAWLDAATPDQITKR